MVTPVRALVLLLVAAHLAGCGACPGPAGERFDARPGAELQVSFPDERPRRVAIPLSAGELLHLRVEQDGVDVVARLEGPAGEALYETDSPTGASGAEELEVVAERSGEHTLRLEPFKPRTEGNVRIRVEARRPASAEDRRRAAASAAYARAELRRLEDRPEEAADAYRAALPLLRAADGTDARLATARWHLGEALAETGELRAAEEALEAALAAFRSREDDLGEARAWTDLGGVRQALGDLAGAEEAHRRALALYRDLDVDAGIATADHNLALALLARGDYGGAADHLRQALARWRRLGLARSEATTLKSLGGLYVRLGREEEGLDLLRDALERLPADERRHRRVILVELAWSHDLAGRSLEALPLYDEALRLARELEGPLEQAAVLGRRASALRHLGRLDEARRDYRRSLHLAEGVGSRLSAGHTRTNLGWMELERDDPAAALEPLSTAAESLDRAGDPGGAAYARLGRARALRRLGRPEEAHRELERAVSVLDSLRQEVPGALSRSHYVAVRYEAYEELVSLELELHRRDPEAGHHRRALEVAERSRARSLLEQLRAGAVVDDDPELRRHRLLREIRALEQRRLDLRDQDPADPHLKELESRMRLKWLQVEALDGAAVSARGGLDAAGVQSLLDADTLMVVFLLAEPRSVAWTVDREEIRVHRLAGRGEIEERARRVVERVQSNGSRTTAAVELALESLADVVVAPLADRLKRFPRLAILADGALYAVPFVALPAADGAPLLTHHELVGLPSATVLDWQRRHLAARPPPPGLAAVVADPVFNEDDERLTGRSAVGAPPADLTRALEDFDLRRLERLVHTADEARAILALAPPDRVLSALGFTSRRELVTTGRLSEYRVLHFATHGLVHPVHPGLSGLVLSLVDGEGRAEDGFLRAHEVAELELRADLAVLSACRTGLGRELRGEGLVGLTHAFFRAGVRQVVISRWSVDDRATSVLMERFYRNLWHRELPPAAALRRAQLSLRAEERWSAPYYWAAFELQGDWR